MNARDLTEDEMVLATFKHTFVDEFGSDAWQRLEQDTVNLSVETFREGDTIYRDIDLTVFVRGDRYEHWHSKLAGYSFGTYVPVARCVVCVRREQRVD